MDNVIHFPPNLQARSSFPSFAEGEDVQPVLSSHEEDEAFRRLICEWPCFAGVDPSQPLQSISEQYYDDELSLSQDSVLEFMFHMHDPNSGFDIGTALYTWGETDRNFFILSLNMHAELIDRAKNEEL